MQTPPRIPGLPLLGNLIPFMRDPLELLTRGYAMHGEIFSFRLGPRQNVAVLIGPEHHRFFFEATDHLLRMRDFYRFLEPMVGDFMAFDSVNRPLIAPTFYGRSLAAHAEAIVEETERWIEPLGDEGELELIETFGALLIHIAARAFMGRDFRAKMGDEFWPLFQDVAEGIELILPLHLPIPRFRRRDRARRELEVRIQKLIDDRRASPNGHHDLLQSLLDNEDGNGERLPDARVRSGVLAIIFAGHETTLGQLSWTLVHLLQHPEYLATVLDEQEEVLADNSAVDLPALNRMKRLRWAIRESERLRPAVSVIARYTTEAYERGGYVIPRGWTTMISPAVAHRLPSVFPDPDRYDPLRFATAREVPHSMAAFGGGKHLCIGREFAYLEMTAILSYLLSRYELALLTPDPQPRPGPKTGRPLPPCLVRYRRR